MKVTKIYYITDEGRTCTRLVCTQRPCDKSICWSAEVFTSDNWTSRVSRSSSFWSLFCEGGWHRTESNSDEARLCSMELEESCSIFINTWWVLQFLVFIGSGGGIGSSGGSTGLLFLGTSCQGELGRRSFCRGGSNGGTSSSEIN